MIRMAFYNADAGSKANGPDDYSIGNNTGLDPGVIALPAAKADASTASFVGLKKKRRNRLKHEMFKKSSAAFKDEIGKIAFGMAGGMGTGMGMGTGTGMRMGMRKGGVVTSKSKTSLGPKIRIVTSKSKKRY